MVNTKTKKVGLLSMGIIRSSEHEEIKTQEFLNQRVPDGVFDFWVDRGYKPYRIGVIVVYERVESSARYGFVYPAYFKVEVSDD